jgi:phosphatidylglycerophosphate synthase
MLREEREKFKKLEVFLGKVFSKIPFSPNQYTFLAFISSIICFFFLVKENFIFALIFFFLSSILDLIDGAVARFKERETKKGAFLDTIFDRYVEGIFLFGFLLLSLKKFIFEAKIWVFLAIFGSLMTTYTKAAAKEKELVKEEIKKGFFGRAERLILIFFAIFLGILQRDLIIYPLVILAIFSNLTAIQRIYLALKSETAFSK